MSYPAFIAETIGDLSLEDRYGQKHNKGAVVAKVVKTGKCEHFLQLFKGNDLLISQEISQELCFDFRVKASTEEFRMSWYLLREDGTPRLLHLKYSDNAQPFKIAISVALFEASYQQEFSSAIDDQDDGDWVTDAVGGTVLADDDLKLELEMQDTKVAYTMGDEDAAPSRADRIKQLSRAKAQESDVESEVEDEEPSGKGFRMGGQSYRTPVKSRGVKDGALTSSMRKGKTTNSLLESGTTLNRTYVARGAKLGVFGYDDEDELSFKCNTTLKGLDGDLIMPDVIQLHQQDKKMLIMDSRDHSKIYNFDIETGKVVDSWAGKASTIFNSIAPTEKYAQTTATETIVGTSDNALFTLDPRIDQSNKIASECEYKTKVGLSTVATTGEGYIATGSKTGDIRLYSKAQKGYCKTQLPGLGDEITHVDLTEDGTWMVATTNKYLLVMPLTVESTGKTGFEGRGMGKEKPQPLKLTILPQDRIKNGIEDVAFTKARFNTGTMANTYERWIVTSTGDFVVTFDFDQIKKGRRDAYKIKNTQGQVVRDMFRHNYQNEIVIAQTEDVFKNRITK
jgi:predicted RNA-binding protein